MILKSGIMLFVWDLILKAHAKLLGYVRGNDGFHHSYYNGCYPLINKPSTRVPSRGLSPHSSGLPCVFQILLLIINHLFSLLAMFIVNEIGV